MQIETGHLDIIGRNHLAAFRQAFPDEAHLRLACHAAFPVALTPDLLYKIWLNFRPSDAPGDLLEMLATVSDIMHSPLCREIGKNLFEMHSDIRTALLEGLQQDPEFGDSRIIELARFLRDYLRYNSDKLPTSVFREAQNWVVESYLEPEKAAKVILDLLQEEYHDPNAAYRVDFYLSWAKQRNQLNRSKAGGATGGDILLATEQMVQGIRQYKAGNMEAALDQFRSIESFIEESEGGDKGFKTRIPTEVWNALRPASAQVKHRSLAFELIEKERSKQTGKLDLGNCGLTEIPGEVFELKWLEELILSNEWDDWDEAGRHFSENRGEANRLSQLPDKIGELLNLKKLIIASGKITDLTPVSNLLSLNQLDFRDNLVSDLNPLQKLTSLTRLGFRNNNISNLGPIGKLSNLISLTLSGNRISDLSSIDQLIQLNYLNFGSNQVSELTPLKNLINLKHIDFRNNHVIDLEPIFPLIAKGITIVWSEDRVANSINAYGNPLTFPPIEIVKKGRNSVIEYFNNYSERKHKSSHKLIPSWNLDVYRYFYGDFTEEHLLVNKPIKEFLENDDKFFLVGAKGLGKTLFLRYKSYRYHEKYGDSIKFNTSHTELTENLNIHPGTFSKEELLQFRDKSLWQLIWELALWVMIFRIFNEPVNPRLEKLLDNAKQLSTILTRLLNNRRKIEQYRDFVSEFHDNIGKIQSGVAIFIDNVDQTMHNLLLIPHPTDEYYEGKESPSVAVWINAQIGLISAIFSITRYNAHAKIYATIRREAFEAIDGEIKINYRYHTSILHYDKDEIRTIFEKNIQLIESTELFDPFGSTLISKFLGFDRIPHRFALDPQGSRRSEDVFDFIYRHTYGRPREIIMIGKQIYDLISSIVYRKASLEERIEKVRALVNREGNELIRQYMQEIVPYLNETKLAHFIEQVRSNIITKVDLQRLDNETIKEYYNLGLIGYVRQIDHSGRMRQIFNPPATYNYRIKHPLPETDYFVIHSTMDTLLLEKHTYKKFYNRYNIIGDGYEFYPKIDYPFQPIEYYLPRDLSGNRMNSPNEPAGHSFPLKEIYQQFFKFDEVPKRHEKLMTHWNAAGAILSLLSRICYCQFLKKQFNNDEYVIKKEEYFLELERLPLKRKYNAELPDIQSEYAFDRFLDKLIGRYITLGCYLVLDMRIEWIHELLLMGKFDFKSKNNKDSAFSYLTRSFFIKDLRRDEPRDAKNHEHRLQKQKIFANLSTFEQDEISSFIRDASDKRQYLNWIEDESHKKWLIERVLPRLWQAK